MKDSYYIIRLGSVFRILYMDEEAATAWERSGWETRSYSTSPDAQAAMEKWKPRSTRGLVSLLPSARSLLARIENTVDQHQAALKTAGGYSAAKRG
jgi:hypothetical protein